jgi:hypothetical protein
MTYKLLVERDGVSQVKVFKQQANGVFVNDWNFSLKEDEPIIFSEFFNETQFAIIGRDGWLGLFDADSKSILLDHKLGAGSSAIISPDKSHIYIGFKDNDYQGYVAILDVSTLNIDIHKVDGYKESIALRQDGGLLLYNHDWQYVNNEKISEHGFALYNPLTKESEFFKLPYPPPAKIGFEFVGPCINAQKNIGVMPFFGKVTAKKSGDRHLFEFKLLTFELTGFKTEILSVRDYEEDQLGCYDDNCTEMASCFLSSIEDKNYLDSVAEFCEDLNSIVFVENGFWLCWRGGILRKVYDDKRLSPLLVTSSISGNSDKRIFSTFHSNLFRLSDEAIVLSEHEDYYVCDLQEIENLASETIIPLSLEKTDIQTVEKLVYTAEDLIEIEGLGKIHIKVNNFENDESIQDALEQMQVKTNSMDTLGIGSQLVFQMEDMAGNILEEPKFFRRAITLKQGPAMIARIVDNFCRYSKARYMHRNEEEGALCHAVFELAQYGEDYLDVVIKYMATIDIDHDVFVAETLLPYLNEKYSRDFLIKRVKPFSERLLEWLEGYWEEEDNDL